MSESESSELSTPGEDDNAEQEQQSKTNAPEESSKDKDKKASLDDDDADPADNKESKASSINEAIPRKSAAETPNKTASNKVKSKVKSSAAPTSSVDQKKVQSKVRSKTVEDVGTAKIGFVGAGRMTECISRGFLRTEKIPSKRLFVSARSTKNFESFKTLGITTTTRPYEIFAKLDCDVVFLCVHGYVIRNCFKMGGTRPFPFTTNYIPWKRKQVVVLSLIGGVPLNDIKTTLLNPEQTQKYLTVFHRVMLNIAVAYNLGYGLVDVDIDSKKCPAILRELLQMLGRIEFLDAGMMDAACALAGNGLAFVYYFISALADGGFKMGLSRERACKLACKTVQSSALSILESNKSPMELRDETTGPSGPAIYGTNVMDKKDFCGGIAHAVESAYKRILELVDSEIVT